MKKDIITLLLAASLLVYTDGTARLITIIVLVVIAMVLEHDN